jgi:hypothetical protein
MQLEMHTAFFFQSARLLAVRGLCIVWPYKASRTPCLALKQFPLPLAAWSHEAAAANYLMHISAQQSLCSAREEFALFSRWEVS